jgi:hypothetical protein
MVARYLEPTMSGYTPALSVTERAGLIRIELGGLAHGDGSSLQEAADDLVRRVLEMALAFRSTGWRVSSELRPDPDAMNFLYELGEFAAAGGDVRVRLFG